MTQFANFSPHPKMIMYILYYYYMLYTISLYLSMMSYLYTWCDECIFINNLFGRTISIIVSLHHEFIYLLYNISSSHSLRNVMTTNLRTVRALFLCMVWFDLKWSFCLNHRQYSLFHLCIALRMNADSVVECPTRTDIHLINRNGRCFRS